MTERMVSVAETASEAISECKKFSWLEHVPGLLADICYTRIECAHTVPTLCPRNLLILATSLQKDSDLELHLQR